MLQTAPAVVSPAPALPGRDAAISDNSAAGDGATDFRAVLTEAQSAAPTGDGATQGTPPEESPSGKFLPPEEASGNPLPAALPIILFAAAQGGAVTADPADPQEASLGLTAALMPAPSPAAAISSALRPARNLSADTSRTPAGAASALPAPVLEGTVAPGSQAPLPTVEGSAWDAVLRSAGASADTGLVSRDSQGWTTLTAPLTANSLTASTATLNLVQTPAPPITLHQPGWEQVLAQRVVWLVNQSAQSASLNVNPPELGPLEVHIEIKQDQASVSFGSAHAAVRESLEAAVPRLREMLAENGLDLLNVNVSAHTFKHPGREAASHLSRPHEGAASDPAEAPPGLRPALGLIDLYA